VFEQFVIFCDRFINFIPLSFVLGFYVAVVVGRWWNQFINIPWHDRFVASHFSLCFFGLLKKSVYDPKTPNPVKRTGFFKSPCFLRATAGRPTAIARLNHRSSVCPSVRLSVTRVDQSKTVQARITKSSPSAARKTLVSETVGLKLFHKFEGCHSE